MNTDSVLVHDVDGVELARFIVRAFAGNSCRCASGSCECTWEGLDRVTGEIVEYVPSDPGEEIITPGALQQNASIPSITLLTPGAQHDRGVREFDDSGSCDRDSVLTRVRDELRGQVITITGGVLPAAGSVDKVVLQVR